jgi:asparagine synthase (glutamine-hydrolysing)
MCGIAGYLCAEPDFSADGGAAVLRRMGRAIAYRGPDDEGVWADAPTGIGLVQRRLAIIDLSPAGHQPMNSHSGRYVIVFNGEIYNYAALRKQLEARGPIVWRGHSDTEVLLAGFEAWGIVPMLEKCIGMFAFALWDRETRVLTLGRDRLGEKPLYYGWLGHSFLFGSELKALRAHPAFKADVNRDAVALLVRYNYIPAPYSIYDGIAKLTPGCTLTVSATRRDATPQPYWSARAVVQAGRTNPFTGTEAEAVSQLESLLTDAVRQQMVADVPLGAFLSGGVDSSTIVALMQAHSTQPIRTFSIGFEEDKYDEAQHAKAVARHLGTNHTEMYVSARDALAVIPSLPSMYDEPFADSSQIPTHLVSRIAKQHVTVSLSGDAGDELFCGYNRYMFGDRLWQRIVKMPLALRRGLATAVKRVSPRTLDSMIRPVQRFLPGRHRHTDWGNKIHKGADVLGYRSSAELYHRLVSHWENPTALVLGSSEPHTALTRQASAPAGLTDVEQMMATDLISYLPDDILCKVDRAAMSVSLESRVPLLDHRVVEFAWRLPQNHKLRDGVSKWVLRQVLYKHVPPALIDRPKMGFGVPIDHWLRGPLKDWAAALLDESRLRRESYFDPRPIRRIWEEHLSGQRDWQYHLWDILTFQAWLEANGQEPSSVKEATVACESN